VAGPGQDFVDMVAIARGYQRSRALTIVAELEIADLLRDGARPVEELAGATGTTVEPLYRVLRALASIGVFHEDDARRFSLTAMGELLRSDHPLTVAPMARMFGADYQWKAWGELPHAVRTGENAAVAALGTDVWEYRRGHPSAGEDFDSAMRTLSAAEVPALLAAYDFARHRVIADLGGGTGANLASILASVPGVRGILFDQPHVVAGADPVLRAAGVAERVEVAAGDFFQSVPTAADLYLMRRILHDWRDEEAAQILRCVRRSMSEDDRLLIVEGVVGPPNDEPLTKFLDLMMLVSAGGRERTEAEWAALLRHSGFRLQRATRATAQSYAIEALPAPPAP
jgi:O-methyltransferase domain